jgi:hypothetical protein
VEALVDARGERVRVRGENAAAGRADKRPPPPTLRAVDLMEASFSAAE